MRAGARVSILWVTDPTFPDLLRERTDDITLDRPAPGSDLIFLGVDSREELGRLHGLREFLTPAGGLWVVRPKGVPRITERDVMEAGLATGLVDNKIASFSDTLSAMRFVVRLRDR